MATTQQQLGASEIDIKLAPLEFCERLCLVKTSPNTDFDITPGQAGPDQTVSVNKLWPALKFNTFNELIGQLKTDFDTKVIGRIKGKLTVAANNVARQAGLSLAQAGFAYLLGKDINSAEFLIVLKKNDSGDLIEDGMIFDFFDSVIEMESPDEYCSSPEFQHAFKIAMARMEMESGEDVMPVQVTTVNSAKKTFDLNAQADQRNQMNQVQPKHKASKRTPQREKKQDEEMDVPVETVEFSGKEANASDTSSVGTEGADDGEEEQGEPSGKKSPKGIRATPVADKLMDWAGMWNSMREQGWNWLPGDGLIDWYYIHPNFAKRSKTEMLRKGKVGEDYFINEESVMRYAKQNLGFRGLVATPASNNNDLKDRALERRSRKRSAAAAATAEPAVETKEKKKKKNSKVGKKQADKNSKAGKKQANATKRKEETKTFKTSNESVDSDTSHFSEGGLGPRSPTLSEAEIDIGVKSAQKKLTYGVKPQRNIHSAPETAEEKRESTEDDYESNVTETESELSDGAESEDDTFQVTASRDAWKLLMDKFGFKYHKEMYCLPGTENKPGKDSVAIEGRHYFPTLMELRKHLCAYGLPTCTAHLEYGEVEAINRWVRFANVKGLPDAAFVNPADVGGYLNFRAAWSMLQKLGLTWSNGYYIVDDPDPTKESKKFVNHEDMFEHLARFGVPHVHSSANVGLTDDDRLRLDLYITSARIDSL